MKRVFVVRVTVAAPGAFGAMLDDLMMPFAVTLEKTVENGLPILGMGTFRCKRDFYHKGDYPTFEIIADGHERILFHRANLETELDGCIAVANSFEHFGSSFGVGDSKAGFAKFWDYYKDEEEIELEIINAPTVPDA